MQNDLPRQSSFELNGHWKPETIIDVRFYYNRLETSLKSLTQRQMLSLGKKCTIIYAQINKYFKQF